MTSNRDNRSILIVDGDPSQQRFLAALLGRGAWRAAVVESGDSGLDYIGSDHGDHVCAILVDGSTKDTTTPSFITKIYNWRPHIPIIAITQPGDVSDAIQYMKAGAADFVQKPLVADRLLGAVERVTHKNSTKDELRPLTEKLRANLPFDQIIGSAPNFRSALAIAAKAARTRIPVLIHGRAGTGKEMFARAIHSASPRSKAPLLMLDCSMMAPGLIASGLFGHERDAFPGAFDRQIGQLMQADGGSIIINHIECIPMETQARLVNFLSTGDVQMVGGSQRQHVDVRIIATSGSPLDRMTDSGHFREDLYYALTTAQLRLPSLSERRSDIAPLARHLLARIGSLPHMPNVSITDEALHLLASYAWKNNVRQLQDVLFRAALSSSTSILVPEDFPAIGAAVHGASQSSRIRQENITVHGDAMGITLYEPDGHLRSLEAIEADVIRLAIGHYRGRMSEVARRLGIGRSTLYRKLADLGIDTAA